MVIRKLLLFLKPLDPYPLLQSDGVSRTNNPQVIRHREKRSMVHKDTVKFCQYILRKKSVDFKTVVLNELSQPIHDVDMVITLGGDGTFLQASHLVENSIPVLGVNSDPTQVQEVEASCNLFDASRSTGHLCGATIDSFEQVLDAVLDGTTVPLKVSRISVKLNSKLLPTYALNDILVAHPNPATVSKFTFKLSNGDGKSCSQSANCRCSGLRVSTAAGSTAAMLSAGGFPMPVLSRDLQYMVREPIISPGSRSVPMHGTIKPDQVLEVSWVSNKGFVYIDGCHVSYAVGDGDRIQVSSDAPALNVFLPPRLLPRL